MKARNLILAGALAIGMPENSYSQDASPKPYKNQIVVGGETIYCNYNKGSTTIWGKFGPDKIVAYLTDRDSNGKLNLAAEIINEEENRYWAEEHFLPSDTEEEKSLNRAKIRKWQPEYEKYLAMFGPKCETK